jgi:outer membrane protein assembly factor BamB
MFGGTPQRNLVSAARNIPASWSIEEGKHRNIKWMVELGTRAHGGPVIADGKVFFGTNNINPRDKTVKGQKAILMCFNEADGKFLWQAVHPAVQDPLAALYGICSVPCVEGKRHYYVTPRGAVICGDNDTGKPVWQYDLVDKQGVVPHHLANCSPLVVDDLVMVVTGNGAEGSPLKVVAPKAPSFIALHKSDGKLAWKSSLPGENIIEGQWSNPTLAIIDGKKQVIFPGGDCWLYSFEPATGELIWKCNCNPLRGTPQVDDGFTPYIIATPVIYDSKCYVGLGLCPDTEVGRVRFSYFLCLDLTGKGDVSPKTLSTKDAANKGSALVWAFGGPISPRPKKGRNVYFGQTMSTAAVHDGLVYISEDTGFVHCLDAKTGERYWVHDLKAGVWGSPSYADGKVFLGSDDQAIVIYEHGKKLKVLGKIDMDEGIHSIPCVANGVLFISTHSKLYAIAEKK